MRVFFLRGCVASLVLGTRVVLRLEILHFLSNAAPLTHTHFVPQALPAVAQRPHNGVAFSGGGSRGYVAALSQIGALHALGLTKTTRTLTAVSGGAWAASVFNCYGSAHARESVAGSEQSTVPRNDDELFGTAYDWRPEEQRADLLAVVEPRAARGAVCRGALIDQVLAELNSGMPPAQAWMTALHKVIFAPAGIDVNAAWTYDAATAAEAVNRGADGMAKAFTVTRSPDTRPFLVICIALLGPASLVPHRPLRLRSYTLLEASPLYAGVARGQNVRYTSVAALPGGQPKRLVAHVGGWIETWAFGAKPAAVLGAETGHRQGNGAGHIVSVEVPPPPSESEAPQVAARQMGIVAAAAASSFAPGGLLATQLPGRRLAKQLGWCVPYYSPTAAAASAAATHGAAPARDGGVLDMLLADGGCLTNPAIHPLLQRGARRIVCFLNYQTMLAPRSVWDPRVRLPTGSDCSEEYPSLFGCILDTSAWCFQHNAVFPLADLARVSCALQDAAAGGSGAVVTLRHVTVANRWWGIPAGNEVTVTWCYLHAAPAWAARLPSDIAARLADASDPELGPSFPHFGTLDLSLTPTQVNLLHSLCMWIVHTHKEQFQQALGTQDSDDHDEETVHVVRHHDSGVEAAGIVGKPSASSPGARSRLASASRLAARALAATLLGARKRPEGDPVAVPTAVTSTCEEAAPVPADSATTRARNALAAAFATVRGVLPLN